MYSVILSSSCNHCDTFKNNNASDDLKHIDNLVDFLTSDESNVNVEGDIVQFEVF